MEEKVHKRRVRYAGRYPKKFEEKYKEHNPEKYADTVAHVIEKGSTPAGMHISIMVKEILDFLEIRPGQQGLDCTLGYGGHSRKMMEKLEGEGRLVGLDIDPIESEKTVKRLRAAGFSEDTFQFRLMNFANIDKVAEEFGQFDFVLADLGVSSMQIDDPKRGFSYKTKVLWICGWILCMATVRQIGFYRLRRRNLKECSLKIPMNRMRRKLQPAYLAD